jgi:flagellar biogenesis protein FliO
VKALLWNSMLLVILFEPVYGLSAPAPAQNQNANAASEPAIPAVQSPMALAGESHDADLQFPVMRTLGGMGLVVFFMVAAFLGAKKFAPRYFNKPSSGKSLKIIETLAMGDRRSISLIEVANSRFLVGNTPQQINLLAVLPESVSVVSEPDAVAVTPRNPDRKEARVPFRNLFEVEKNRPPQGSANPLPEDLRTKMRQLREALERS